ncbi:DUF4129 domain-containing protein [Micromonospora globbae]|uniref:DUF4129 domain-containing protein n=1 Tax=Micromonospora globbae TaxID=1894969 RepID=UPI003870653A|nr:DUF4129 domain-containing protein [Micromonospora globbae]
MTGSRWWTETTAALGDRVPLWLVTLLLVALAGLVAAAWYTFPAWVPRRFPRPRLPRLPRLRLRWPRLRLPRLRWPRLRRRRRAADAPAADPAPVAPDAPATPATGHLPLADRLAADGRYAEAVRERLRDMIRELAVRQVVPPRPGLTVREVAATAARNRPPAGPPMAAAGEIFSELWYAQRPATAAHDRRMRELADELHRALHAVVPGQAGREGP